MAAMLFSELVTEVESGTFAEQRYVLPGVQKRGRIYPPVEGTVSDRLDLPKDCVRWVKSGTDGLTRDRFLRIRPQA